MNPQIELPRKMAEAYAVVCKPLCKQLGLPQTAFDILMFLGNNPEYRTASDIVNIRHIKANLVSVHVDRLVREGYLTRHPVKDDRRKTELHCTDRALPVIARGKRLQKEFTARLFAGTDEETRRVFAAVTETMMKNLDRIREETN